jgi:hypothetical protein
VTRLPNNTTPIQKTERDYLLQFAEGMKMARDAAKMLSFARNTKEWLSIANLLGTIAFKSGKLDKSLPQ